MTRSPILSIFLLALAAVLAGARAAAQGADPGVGARQIYREIAKERDKVDQRLFDQLAKFGDEGSLKLLMKATDAVKQPYRLNAAYAAFRLYIGKDDLDAKAFGFLEDEVFKARREEAREAALRALAHFGNRAQPVFERSLNEHKDESVRRAAVDHLVPHLGRQGDRLSVLAILQYADLRRKPMRYFGLMPDQAALYSKMSQREVVLRSLDQAKGEDVREALIARLLDPETEAAWKLLLVETLAPRKTPDVTAALVRALRDTDATVVSEAAAALGARGEDLEVAAAIEPLLRAGDESVRRAAVAALGKLRVLDPKWWRLLLELSREPDLGLRIGAAAALAELHTEEAMARLYELLQAPEWTVRAEVVKQLAGLRKEQSVPRLIARLDLEGGRMREEVARALRLLTGLDHGRAAVRWDAWWAAEGAAFKLPGPEEALAAENERREREAANQTSTSFYGVPIFSERICFVVDRSGSMVAKTSYRPQGTSAGEPAGSTRIEVAKRELIRAVRALAEGRFFNIIFFDSRVEPWQDALVKQDERIRDKAVQYVTKQTATGGTALYDGLWLAFQDPLVDTIYVLTDGQPSAGKVVDIYEIRREVARWNATRHVQIHGISVGQESELLRWISADSGGEYRRVD